jgi:hypothetical protein
MNGASEEAEASGGEVADVLRRKEEVRDVALAGPRKKILETVSGRPSDRIRR